MSFVNPEAISQAKKMDLLTYLQNYEPNELVNVSGDSLHCPYNDCADGGKTDL